MMNLIRNIKAAFSVARREEGQGSIEWLLLMAVGVTAIIAAVAAGLPGTLISSTITAVQNVITNFLAGF